MRIFLTRLTVTCALVTAPALATSAWPNIALPRAAHSYQIADQLTANGMSMQLQGFNASGQPTELAAWFRKSLGQPLVENKLGKKIVLGRLQDGYYLTVQLEAQDGGTRGLVAVSRIQADVAEHRTTQEAAARLLARLPAGTKILTHTSAIDSGKASVYVLLMNQLHEDVNRAGIVAMLREDGYALERETTLGSSSKIALPAGVRVAKLLLFKGAGKEAMAVIFRGQDGQTTVILNTVTALEQHP